MAQLSMGSPSSVTSQVGMVTKDCVELVLLRFLMRAGLKHSFLSALSVSTYRGGIPRPLLESPLTKGGWREDESSQAHK